MSAEELRAAEEEKMVIVTVANDATQYNKDEEAEVPATAYNLSKLYTSRGIIKGINTAIEAANAAKKTA